MSPIGKAADRPERSGDRLRRCRRLMRFRNDPRTATWILTVASAVSVGLILYFGRGTTFSGDESIWVASTPEIDLRTIFTPHGGHLLALSRFVYWPILEVFGIGYLPFRLLTIGAVLLTVWLLYAYGRRRTDHFVALAPCLVLLFFGADFLHLFQGNGFTVILPLALGVGALLAFERDDLNGDLLACLWLTIGIFVYSTILPFVVGIGVLVLIRRDRWRRIWIPLVPAAIYCLWRIWLVAADVGGTGRFDPMNLLLVPAWSFQSLCGILNSLTGLSFAFSGGNTTAPVDLAGPPLAVLLIGMIGWKISRSGLGRGLLAALLVTVSFFALQAVVSTDSGVRLPGVDTRYLYPGAVMVTLILFELCRSWRPSRRGLVAVLLLTICGLATNLTLMNDNSDFVRKSGQELRSLTGAMALAIQGKPAIAAKSDPSTSSGQSSISALVGMAQQDYGEFAYGPSELAEQPPERRKSIDQIMVMALGLAPNLLDRPIPDSAVCRTRSAGADGVARATAPPGRLILRSGAGGTVAIGRFADQAEVPSGSLAPGEAYELILPGPSTPKPWKIAVTTPELEVCTDR